MEANGVAGYMTLDVPTATSRGYKVNEQQYDLFHFLFYFYEKKGMTIKLYCFPIQQVQLQKADPTVTMFDGDVQQLTFEVIHHEEYHLQIKVCYYTYL